MKAALGCQEFPWGQHMARRGHKIAEHLDEALAACARCGLAAWEPFLPATREQVRALGEAVARHKLVSPSAYANVRLHEDDWQEHVQNTVEAANWGREIGVRVLVVNPEPINWNQPLDKDDAQLEVQARAMEELGRALNAQNQKLAYHIHAPEMRRDGREFHWTLEHTSSEAVGLCLDTHWIYRGSNNSPAALDEAVRKYLGRVVSLHVRQSRGGVWSEAFEDGEHTPLARALEDADFSGPLILEQAHEAATPQTMEFEAALKRGADYARRIFGVE